MFTLSSHVTWEISSEYYMFISSPMGVVRIVSLSCCAKQVTVKSSKFLLDLALEQFSCYLLFDRRTGNHPAFKMCFAIFGWLSLREWSASTRLTYAKQIKRWLSCSFLKGLWRCGEDPNHPSVVQLTHTGHTSPSTIWIYGVGETVSHTSIWDYEEKFIKQIIKKSLFKTHIMKTK